MESKDRPLVSIIIPVRPGGVVKALDSVRMLEYPRERLEVLVAEGSSPSKQRNEAVNLSKGEIIYFLDDDACPDKNNIENLTRHFEDPDIAVVGGPSITPDNDTFIQKCFASLFTSPLGGAGVRNRYRRAGGARLSSESELILCNLSFRAKVYKEMGGLDERLYPNEENDMMARINDAGHNMIYDPDVFVLRSQRKTFRAFVRQVLNYGRGRMEQTIINPSSLEMTHFVPLFFLLYCMSLPVFHHSFYFVPLICYMVLATFFSLWAVFEESTSCFLKIKKMLCLMALFPVMHLGYGAGMIWGGLRCFSVTDSLGAEVNIKRVELA